MPLQSSLRQYVVDIYRIAEAGNGTYHQLPCANHVDRLSVIAKSTKDAERKARYLSGCRSKLEFEAEVMEVG